MTPSFQTGIAWSQPVNRPFGFKFQGRDFRLTDVHGNVVQAILA
jgi:hypothetical protein